MRALLTAAVCAATFPLAGNAWAADPSNGKAIAEKVCAACHGAEGNKPVAPENPILAGQYPDYIAKALSDYKSGKRANPVMKVFAGQLSKKDIEDVAAWFSSQQSNLHFQR